jgi:hypothetical protein
MVELPAHVTVGIVCGCNFDRHCLPRKHVGFCRVGQFPTLGQWLHLQIPQLTHAYPSREKAVRQRAHIFKTMVTL